MGKFQLYGTVVYHCADCGQPIPQGEHVFVDAGRVLDEGESVTNTTRSFHAEHIPSEVKNGR